MEKQRPVVLVDMDGVMADFDKAATASISQELRLPRSSFYVAHDYPEALRPQIEAAYNTPGFFEDLEPLSGMLQGWQTLLDNGYEPRVASAPLSSNSTAIEGKVRWLARVMVPEFGARVVERAIIDKNKWKYSGLALIDDRPAVPRGPAGSDAAEWEQILFGWEHLPIVPLATTAFRLITWHDTDTLLANLELIHSRKQTDGSTTR